MAAKGQRPYLKRSEEFFWWKKNVSTRGGGVEVTNYASPIARELWYYLRSMGRVKHPPGWKHEHHGTGGFLLHVILRGELLHEVKGRTHIARRGQACLLDLSQDVNYRVEGGARTDFFWVLLNAKDMPRVFMELRADLDPLFPLSDLKLVVSLLRKLQEITIREPIAYEVRSSGLLTLILAELFAGRPDLARLYNPDKTKPQPLSEPIRKGVDYMIRFYDLNFSVKHLAGVVGLSLHYFSRRFHQEVGKSPVAYLNHYRIEQAKKLLAKGNQSVAQIARSVGFHSQHYFSRSFRRIAGANPLAYRKKSRAGTNKVQLAKQGLRH